MLKQKLLVLLILATLIMCKLSVTDPTPATNPSVHSLTVSWQVKGEGARTILPASYPMPATYDVLLHPTSRSDVSQTGLTSTSWTFNNLSAVVYAITVTGKDSGSNVILSGTGSADMTAVAVQNPAIILQYISTGMGTGQIQLTFDATSAGVTVTATSLTLVGPTGTIIVNGASLTGNSPVFTYTNTSATVGSYKMFTKFTTASQVAMKIDTIIVLQNVPTVATIQLASGDFNNQYVPVAGLSLNYNSTTNPMNLNLGGATGTLAATLSPTNASNTLVAWSSSGPSIASVNQSGVVTAVAAGAATVTATSVDNSSVNASCTVNIYLDLTYNANGSTGGSVPTDSNNYQQGATVTVLGNTGSLARTSYNFAGWNTQANGNGTTYTQGQTFLMGTANVTMYAIWAPIPATPTGLSVGSTTSSTLLVSWNASSGAITYQVYRNGGSTAVYNGISTSFTDSGLASGTLYSYTVQATNSAGSSTLSTIVSGTPIPTTPTGLTVGSATSSSLSISWTASSGATSYQLFRNGSQVYSGSSPTYSDAGLTSGTTYSYTIMATNGGGSSALSSAVSGTTIPLTPTGLHVTATTWNNVSLAWNASTGATSYQIIYSTYQVTMYSGSGTACTFQTNSQQTYSFTVQATNSGGSSAQSTAVVVTTPP